MFEAGTNVLLAKSIGREIFLRALELAVLGETLLPGGLLPQLRSGNPQRPQPSGPIEAFDEVSEQSETDGTPPLSARERSILLGLVAGESNKVIARRIGIAESTVKVHVKTILRKIRAHNRTQAAIWALNNNIGAASPGISPDGEVEPLMIAEHALARAANGGRH